MLLQSLLNESEVADNKDLAKAISSIKKKLKDRFKNENVNIKVEGKGSQIVVTLEYTRTLTEKEFDYGVEDLKDAIEAADESGRWTFKDTGSYFADPAALMPKRGQMIDGGALLCDIEYTVTIPNVISRKKS